MLLECAKARAVSDVPRNGVGGQGEAVLVEVAFRHDVAVEDELLVVISGPAARAGRLDVVAHRNLDPRTVPAALYPDCAREMGVQLHRVSNRVGPARRDLLEREVRDAHDVADAMVAVALKRVVDEPRINA